MAGEIQFGGPGSSRTCYVLIRNRNGLIWNTSGGTGAFQAYDASVYTSYAISASEQGSNNFYTAAFPAAIPAGVYSVSAHQQLGGDPAQTDTRIAAGTEQWNGAALMPLSDVATSGQLAGFTPVRLARGVAVSGFPFKLVSAADHVTPFTSGVVSGQISKDGGSFGALQSGAFTEIGLGWYRTNLTSGDLAATTVALVFTAVGISGGSADQRDIGMVLQKVSGF